MVKINKFLLFSLAFLLCVLVFLTPAMPIVYASSIDINGGYSGVLEDLQKDAEFNADDYEVIMDDYSLQVISLAEGSNKELFVYVYQPSGSYAKLTATSINISTGIHENLSFKNYKLTLLNYSGVFYKYLVNDFVVSNDTTRYYEIPSIFRAWNSYFDDGTNLTNENTIDEVSFKVGKQYKFVSNTSGGVSMSVSDIDTIEVVSRYDGFIEYPNGFKWFMSDCNAYFVAFKTDKKIDYLLEADVFYTEKEYTISKLFGAVVNTHYGNPEEKYAYLKYDSIAENNPGIGVKYEWERIESVAEFKDSLEEDGVTMSDELQLNLQGKEWVLRFAETEVFTSPITNGSQSINGRVIENVTILRLAFMSDGDYYNLGVVDNKQSADMIPDGTIENPLLSIILTILLIVLVVVLLGPILPTIFSIIMSVLGFLLKVVWWVVKLPFRFIGWLFKKRSD